MITFEMVCEILRDIFDEDSMIILNSDSAKTIEKWDSLAQISIITSLENAFDIEFSFSEINNIQNVGELAELIDKKRGV